MFSVSEIDVAIDFELDKDGADATMTTMVENPCVCHVPTLTGGIGYNRVYNLHKSHFSCKMPKDMKITDVSICGLKCPI
jgi:carboxymethylenebutenolidase